MLASLCTAAIFGATAQAAPTFESVLALVAQLQDDVMTLSTECAAKDDEMVGLNSLLSECGEGTPPAVPADEPVEPEAPTPEPPAPAPSVDGEGFTFSIGQSWNYNLDMPWNIDDVEVDVYFIDMSKWRHFLCCVCFCTLLSGRLCCIRPVHSVLLLLYYHHCMYVAK